MDSRQMMSSFRKLCAFVNNGFAAQLSRDDLVSGSIYMFTALMMGLIGGVLPLLLAIPPLQKSFFITHLLPIHPLLMQFYCAVPVLVCALSTFFLPRALGRRHMLLGRANLLAACLVAFSGFLTLLFPSSALVLLPWCLGLAVSVTSILITAFESCADLQNRKVFSFFVWAEVIAAAFLLVTLPLFAGHIVSEIGYSHANLSIYARQFLFPCDTVALLCGFGLIFGFVKKTLTQPMRLLAIASMIGVASCNMVAWSRMLLYGYLSVVSMESFYGASRVLSLVGMVFAFILAGVWLASAWYSHVKSTIPLLWGVGYLCVIALGWFCYFSHYPVLHSMVQISALYAVCDAFYMWRENTHFWYSKPFAYLQFALTFGATLSLLIPFPTTLMLSRLLFALSAMVFLGVVAVSLAGQKRVQYATLIHSS